MWQIILTIIFYLWLFLVLWLLWAIWRDSSRRLKQLEQTLIEATLSTAEAAKQAAEAARLLAEKREV